MLERRIDREREDRDRENYNTIMNNKRKINQFQ